MKTNSKITLSISQSVVDEKIAKYCLKPEATSLYPSHEEWLKKCIGEKRNCFVLKNKNKIYGCAIIKERENPYKRMKLCFLYIDPCVRRQGYADKIMKAIYEYAISNGFYEIYLSINTKADKSIKDFCIKQGFGFLMCSDGGDEYYRQYLSGAKAL